MKDANDNRMHEITWNNDLSSIFSQNSSGRSYSFSEGVLHLNSNIIAGLDKANQLLREPFAQYFMQIDKLIYESDAILFIGYGFADKHLNNNFPFIRFDKNKIRKIVVIDWASDNEDGLWIRQDNWSYGLFQAIPTDAREMGGSKSSFHHNVDYFKGRNMLEKSFNKDLPLSVWYNGFLKACENPDSIICELK